jgi:hypothetical protein
MSPRGLRTLKCSLSPADLSSVRRLTDFSKVVVSPPWRGTLRSDSFECRAVAVVGDTAALEPCDRASTLWLPDRLDNTLLSFRHDGSLVGLCGTLWLRERVGDLRYTVTDGIAAPGRRASRIDISAPIELRRVAASAPVPGTTVNLSAYGVLVDCEIDVAPEDKVFFSLTLPGVSRPFEAMARVARIADDGRIGLDIDPSNRLVRSALAGFVVEYNRAILHRRPQQTGRELDF